MYDFIGVECSGPVTTITPNRPQVLNAINPQMHVELEAAIHEFSQREEQRVCVNTGAAERAFCAGSDLKAQARDSGFTYPPPGYAGLIERFDLYKPVIAAVNGICLGGGFEVAFGMRSHRRERSGHLRPAGAARRRSRANAESIAWSARRG